MNDRRQSQRVQPREPMLAKIKASVPARIIDISTGGAQLEVLTSLRPHVHCELRLRLEHGEVVIGSVVRRCKAWGFGFDENERRVLLYRAGLEFEEVPAEVTARIRAELLAQGLARGSSAAFRAVSGGEDDAMPPAEPVRAPVRNGPVKVRISADHLRGIADKNQE
jgi:hypothetical protein